MKVLTSVCLVSLLLAAPSAVRAAEDNIVPPRPDVWFSLEWPVWLLPVTDRAPLHPGDVLSVTGRVVATNRDLLANFHPMPSPEPVNYGLDALLAPPIAPDSVTAPRPILFSTERGFFDEQLGVYVSDGDLLRNDGRVVATNRQLLAGFHPMPVVEDYGLDAVFVLSSGPATDVVQPPEVWFSIEEGFFDEVRGVYVGQGDVLSSRGHIIATNAELLRAFDPVLIADHMGRGVGLDALFVPPLPPGVAETDPNLRPVIWFSTERGFFSRRLHRWIGGSDLISSDGRVILTGFELLREFGPHWPPIGGLDAMTLAVPLIEPADVDALMKGFATPEPATACLLLLSGAAALVRHRRK